MRNSFFNKIKEIIDEHKNNNTDNKKNVRFLTRGNNIVTDAKKDINETSLLNRIKDIVLSFRFAFQISFAIVILLLVGIVSSSSYYVFYNYLVKDETARVQNESVLMTAMFTEYESLSEADAGGLYSELNKHSSLNSTRIRILDTHFIISKDTYSVDTGKTLLNSQAISVYKNQKTVSIYDKEVGNIEAVAPIYNNNNRFIGIMLVDMHISKIDELMDTAMESILAISLLTSIVIIILAVFLVRRLTKSTNKMMEIVEDIDLGHTDLRLDESGYTEIKKVAKHFNNIMDKASELDANRQEFVSNVSHELKTPLTSMKVLADSLNLQENVPIEFYQEFMQDITSEIDRENKIIEDLLTLVRLDKSANANLNLTSVNVNELLELVLKRLKPLAQKKNIEILYESFRPVVAQIDEVKITQVVSNLVENAIKYNNVDGWVHVSLNADYQYFYIRVEDSGLGIPQESQGMVFERFYRVDKARSRETGGTGLGLAIVRNIVLMHRGNIKLHSEEGVGTTFTVRLPLQHQ